MLINIFLIVKCYLIVINFITFKSSELYLITNKRERTLLVGMAIKDLDRGPGP